MMKIVCVLADDEEKSISDIVKRSQNFVNKIIVCDPITHSAGVVSSFLELIAITEFEGATVTVDTSMGIPSWFKDVAGFYSQGVISDTELANNMEFLIREE